MKSCQSLGSDFPRSSTKETKDWVSPGGLDKIATIEAHDRGASWQNFGSSNCKSRSEIKWIVLLMEHKRAFAGSLTRSRFITQRACETAICSPGLVTPGRPPLAVLGQRPAAEGVVHDYGEDDKIFDVEEVTTFSFTQDLAKSRVAFHVRIGDREYIDIKHFKTLVQLLLTSGSSGRIKVESTRSSPWRLRRRSRSLWSWRAGPREGGGGSGAVFFLRVRDVPRVSPLLSLGPWGVVT